MLTAILLAALGQCANGQCALPAANFNAYSFAPRYAAPVTYAPPVTYVRPLPLTTPTCAPPAAPQQYELRDGYGMVWSHSNPDYLKAWVAGYKAGREASVQAVTRTSARTAVCPAGCGCVVPGECGKSGCDCVRDVPPPPR